MRKGAYKTILQDDIRGKKFGKLLVIGDDFKVIKGKKFIECLCDCGEKCFKVPDQIKRGIVSSCGCRIFSNLQGMKFGSLNVISKNGIYLSHVVWNCKCDCGKLVKVTSGNLKSGNSKSCGCLAKLNNLYSKEIKYLKCLNCDGKFKTCHRNKKFCCGKCRNKYNNNKKKLTIDETKSL